MVEELNVGAMVKVEVYALSYDPVVAVPVALCHMISTVFLAKFSASLVCPSR